MYNLTFFPLVGRDTEIFCWPVILKIATHVDSSNGCLVYWVPLWCLIEEEYRNFGNVMKSKDPIFNDSKHTEINS
jgi:hypothetical protein